MTLFDRRTFFVKERVGFMKLTDIYDILDPESGKVVGIAMEEPPGWARYTRLIINKALLPTRVNIYEEVGGPVLLSIYKPGLFRRQIPVATGAGRHLGHFRTKMFSLGGGFWVHDAKGERFAEVKGDWKAWNFRFLTTSGKEIGLVAKKWAGLGKEFFTSADNYVISVEEVGKDQAEINALLLAAGLSIDMVFKEAK